VAELLALKARHTLVPEVINPSVNRCSVDVRLRFQLSVIAAIDPACWATLLHFAPSALRPWSV